MKKELIKFGILTLIILIVGFSFFVGIKTIIKLRNENNRISNNFLNSQFIIDSVKNKNGEYHKVVNGLMLTKKELKQFNDSLVDEISNLNIKLKKVGTITKIEYVYVYDIDTFIIEKYSDSVFKAKYSDDWIDINQRVLTFNQGKDIKIDSIHIEVNDSLLLVEEVDYKGCWFWKRAVGFQIHVESKNPYINLNKIQYYKIGKHRR